MSIEQSQDPQNNSAATPADVPPPVPSAPAVEETPPPAPTPVPAAAAPVASTSSAKDKKLLAGILGIVLGGFGVHKFVLGYTKEGIIQIVITFITCGFGSIIGLIEGIIYLTKSEEEFHRLYIQGKKSWF